MTDPATISIAAVGAVALTEGVKFLYGQAGDILKEWRSQGKTVKSPEKAPEAISLPNAFDGQLRQPSIDYGVVALLEPDLSRLYRELSEYATDLLPIEIGDEQLLRNVHALRQCLESVLHQHITFKGENRPRSGTLIEGHVIAETIAGEATGVEGEGPARGEVHGSVEVRTVNRGAKVVGTKWKI
jgi:hypothetical protein